MGRTATRLARTCPDRTFLHARRRNGPSAAPAVEAPGAAPHPRTPTFARSAEALFRSYRARAGHLIARIRIRWGSPRSHAGRLEPRYFGFRTPDSIAWGATPSWSGSAGAPAEGCPSVFRRTYCGSVGAQFPPHRGHRRSASGCSIAWSARRNRALAHARRTATRSSAGSRGSGVRGLPSEEVISVERASPSKGLGIPDPPPRASAIRPGRGAGAEGESCSAWRIAGDSTCSPT
jgi:hypothetical protein